MASLSASSTTVIGRDTSSYGYGHLEMHATNAMSGLGKLRKTSDQYQALINEINKYWVGSDAEEFKTLLSEIANLVEEGYKLSEKALKTIRADKSNFEDLRSRNNSAIRR